MSTPNDLPPCDHDECPPTGCKHNLAKSIGYLVANIINRVGSSDEDFKNVVEAAKRSIELGKKLNDWSNKELLGETERCQFEALKVRVQELERKNEQLLKCLEPVLPALPLAHPKRNFLFFRSDGFYPLTLPDDQSAKENAELNPGTIRVETASGQVVWADNNRMQ